MTAKITALDGEISELSIEIGFLSGEITQLETDIENAGTTRKTEHEKYLEVAASMTFAIESVQKALASLKASKGAMTAADLDYAGFAQLKTMAALSPVAAALKVTSLLQTAVHQPAGQPDRSVYHSNDIIGILEVLEKKFISYKTDLDTEEFNTKAAYDKNVLNMQNIKKFKSAEKAEKEATHDAKSEEKSATETDKGEETADKTADQNFMGELKTECETKAGEFDQRSKMRADELTALDKAITALKEGAAPNWKANKKLVGLSKSAKVNKKSVTVSAKKKKLVGISTAVKVTKKAVDTSAKATKKAAAPAFLQLASHHHREEKDTQVVRKALHVIQGAAGRLHSAVLSAASLKVTVSIDHFVKVRQIIKDLVDRLEADASAEADTKSYCDKEMSAAITKRDTNKALIEDLEAKLDVELAKETTLMGDIATLAGEIADNEKQLKELTELWGLAEADNTLTLAEAEAAIEAVKQAISILETFYDGALPGTFVQYVPPNSDREGLTVGDRAPEITEGTYHGEQDSSKGIISMLNVILSDFERTKSAVTSKNTNEETAYDTNKGLNEADTTAKDTAKGGKNDELTAAKAEIISLKDQIKDAKTLLAEAEKGLSDLESMCVDGEKYEDRVASRQEEIAALKEALNILIAWKS